MHSRKYLQHVVVGAIAVAFVGARLATGEDVSAPVVAEAASIVNVEHSTTYLAGAVTARAATADGGDLTTVTRTALAALRGAVRSISHPSALENAFGSYFAYKAANPGAVTKPYLYFVDYGLPSTTPRGYVFDMEKLTVVKGPFTVAHGSGSAKRSELVPTRFSNRHGSNSTSLGLYLAQETYNFSGKSGGRRYTSVGLRLKGLSTGFNDNARARGVVAHGAPYVTASRAGRSQGCPAVTQQLARELLPKIANGGMVFLFAPDARWMSSDKWVVTANTGRDRAPVTTASN
jgi:hypothetical protein